MADGITAALKSAKEDKAAKSFIFHEVIWDDVVAIEQAKLADVLCKGFGLPALKKSSNIFVRLITWPKRTINALRTSIVAQYIEDVLSYRDEDAYALIHGRVRDALQKIAQENTPSRLSIIAHSLGTVIASDFIYDAQKQGLKLAGQAVFTNFFTLGSPIALFALQYGGVDLFKSPARLEASNGVWLNIYDKDDPIGYPLKNLNDAYNSAVTEEVWVDTGWFGFAHTKYFENKSVHCLIAGRLA